MQLPEGAHESRGQSQLSLLLGSWESVEENRGGEEVVVRVRSRAGREHEDLSENLL